MTLSGNDSKIHSTLFVGLILSCVSFAFIAFLYLTLIGTISLPLRPSLVENLMKIVFPHSSTSLLRNPDDIFSVGFFTKRQMHLVCGIARKDMLTTFPSVTMNILAAFTDLSPDALVVANAAG